MASAQSTLSKKELVSQFGRYKKDDRVMRQHTPGNKSAGFIRGKIVAVRARANAPDLYDVQWDHDTTVIDKGYLAHGLQTELFLV